MYNCGVPLSDTAIVFRENRPRGEAAGGPGTGDKLHGAACHACSFLSETCCERGNKYLDRWVLLKTLERDDLAFFG